MTRAASISFIETAAALVYAEEHFLVKTPMRWQLIAEYVLKCIPVLSGKPESHEVGPAKAPIVPLMALGNASSSINFQCTLEMYRSVYAIISSLYRELLCYAQPS